MKLDQIRALIGQATPPPWQQEISQYGLGFSQATWAAIAPDVKSQEQAKRDAAFVAASRTLMPKLLAVAEAAKAFELSKKTDHAGSGDVLCDWGVIHGITDALAALEASE